MPPTLLSIIIVAYKSRDEILDCVRSLPSEMDGGRVETIVVDNSLDADGTCTLLRTETPSVRVVLPPSNLGFGRANNLGFAESTGELVLFLNPDTVSNPEALTRCAARLRADATIGLISPRLELADGSMDLACRRSIPTLWDGFCRATGLAAAFPGRALFTGYNLTHLDPAGSYDVGAINGAFMMGRRAFLSSIAAPAPQGIFDADFFMYGDDLDLCLRVARAGKRIVYDGSVRLTHLKGQSVAKDYDRMSEAIFDANRDVYLKHFNPRGSRLVALKYHLSFGAWKLLSRLRASLRGHRRVKPL
jgi:GT2 family glycosyltransferase